MAKCKTPKNTLIGKTLHQIHYTDFEFLMKELINVRNQYKREAQDDIVDKFNDNLRRLQKISIYSRDILKTGEPFKIDT